MDLGTLRDIVTYPVKGLNGRSADSATVQIGQALAGDRRFAIAHKASRFDPLDPEWQPKSQFVVLMRHERLAQLTSTFDTQTGVLTLSRGNRQVARGDITRPLGRDVIDQFLSAFLATESRGVARIVEGPATGFPDRPKPFLSIINRTTCRDIERVARAPVDPARFRGNLIVETGHPWAEFGWVGQEIAIGEVRLRIEERIERCPATQVNPATAARDLNVPKILLDGFGHMCCGVMATVSAPGRLEAGAAIRLV
ncbi:MAG: MOSC domain-containing protein [Azospirillaceae bacterium]